MRCRPFKGYGGGMDGELMGRGGELGLRYQHTRGKTRRKRHFTPVFCEALVSLRSSRPIRANAWLSHGNIMYLIYYVPTYIPT